MKKLYRLLPIALSAMPMMALAAATNTFEDWVTVAEELAEAVIPLFMILAVAVFLWGIVKYVTAGGDAEKEKGARGYIIYGLIGIFVLVAFWGIVAVIANTLGVTPGEGSVFPDIPTISE